MAYMDKVALNQLGQKVTNKLSTKVDKVEGKVLSTNDYDNAAVEEVAKIKDKVDKVEGMGLSSNDYDNAAVAEVAKVKDKANIDSPTFTGTVTVPTATIGTADDTIASTAFVVSAVNKAVNKINSFEYVTVTELPDTGKTGTIYLILNGGGDGNIYDEYIWVEEKFELIGTTEMDLSGYVKTEEFVSITNAQIDAAFADDEA